MSKPISYLFIKDASLRLKVAQKELVSTIAKYNLDPFPYLCGPNLVEIGDLLKMVRNQCTGHAFVWCNSDVALTRDPFDVPDRDKVYGFIRREIPSGEYTDGIDMVYIPVKVWDEILSKDVPRLLLGASYVDWWIPRCMEKYYRYEKLKGYIDHITHPRSFAATLDSNKSYQHNFRQYNKWAKRHSLPPIPAPRFLVPFVGHVHGVRDLLKKLIVKNT